ncbi:ubiquitin-activating enzyme E1, putative [Entamoeba invadens IP1]|uniref:Ubiquitin-activating enzyme E1, putative n=1 Tax=Entamoeba invadens IP1 TaxID=370355 RepID=A0A0A1TUL2_ENTIV|nr:ubiquitin-activating enzyme E1, putative [Entamoeba invadens IP1]ELP83762.1 ubiquitin-activating enzyme E1, putative [Entamoeba invadens IP1]|eukprot:XP_004183108.1 ubiquitin-activating enzyme E1, putative [Entamoeba invadens IP1]
MATQQTRLVDKYLSATQKCDLSLKHVLIVGLGGVGSYTAEILARSGVGHLTIVDADVVAASNINRQLPATPQTIGRKKVEVVKERLQKINPEIKIETIERFIENEGIQEILKCRYDYVVDAIDSVSPKVFLIKNVMERGMSLVSSFGSGGRFDPTKVGIADISQTEKDQLMRVVRYRLHKHGIRTGFKAVYSLESPDKGALMFQEEKFKKSSFGTLSYMTSIFGAKCAEVVLRDLTGNPVVTKVVEKRWEQNGKKFIEVDDDSEECKDYSD